MGWESAGYGSCHEPFPYAQFRARNGTTVFPQKNFPYKNAALMNLRRTFPGFPE